MKKTAFVLAILLALSLLSCSEAEKTTDPETTEVPAVTTEAETKLEEFSCEGLIFRYGDKEYNVNELNPSANAIMSLTLVGGNIVVECHVNPKNSVYLIYDTASDTFVNEICGVNLTWHSDDITTAVYSFWGDICAYDGTTLASIELDGEYIRSIEFAENNTKLIVTVDDYEDGFRTVEVELGHQNRED